MLRRLVSGLSAATHPATAQVNVLNAMHRGTLMWLLVCQTLVIAPFVDSHPLWLIALLAACLAWRARALRRGEVKPRAVVVYLLVCAGLLGLYASGYVKYTIDSMVAIVLLGFVLKIVETWSRRDTLMLVCVGYFLSAAHFIYSQTPWQTLYTLVAVMALTACSVSAHQTAQTTLKSALKKPLKTAAGMMLLSAPLAVLLFFIIPRIPPLWSMPQQSQASAGLSDEITPGDIASLVKSPKPAFRVKFEGAPPNREDWYWRALVFQEFDGSTWRLGPALGVVPIPPILKQHVDQRYQIIMQPSGQRWIPSLDTPVVFDRRKAVFSQFRTLRAINDINSTSGYQLGSNVQLASRYRPGPYERGQALQLPPTGSERLRRWSVEMLARAGSEADFVEAVLSYIRDNDFYYTLQPPRLFGAAAQDRFWFESRQGFCSHYASAFVFIMRSAGLPARLVGGYQGGRYNVDQQFITVRQMDAHAWAEVLLPERGWVRVDPTAAVAPERVRQDLSDVFADTPDAVAELAGRTSDFAPWRAVQLWLDTFEYQWQRWVVQFSESQRVGLLDKLLGNSSLLVQVVSLLGVFSVIAALWVLLLGGSRQVVKKRAAVRCFEKLQKRLAKQGVQRHAGETAAVFLARAMADLPQQRAQLEAIATVFYSLEYRQADAADYKQRLAQLRRLVSANS